MSQPELKSVEEYWFLLRFFYRIYNYVSTGCTWLFVEQFELPNDASGELMRRTLAKKSWFDELSSSWVERSFWTKMQVVLGSSLAAGIVGLFVGAPMLLSFTALFLVVSVHVLLVSHEHHRQQTVKLMARETIELNQELTKEQQFVATHAQAVKETAQQLTQKKERLQVHLERLEETVAVVIECKNNLEVRDGELLEAERSLSDSEHHSKLIEKVEDSLKVNASYLQKHSVFMEQQRLREQSQKYSLSLNLAELDADLEEGMALMAQIKQGIKQ